MKNKLGFKYFRGISRIGICFLYVISTCIKDPGYHDQTNIGQSNNPFGYTLLHMAVLNDNLEKVEQLCLDPAVNVNESDKYGTSPLHFAAERGDLQIVKSLLSH